jgi:hypothetical protein
MRTPNGTWICGRRLKRDQKYFFAGPGVILGLGKYEKYFVEENEPEIEEEEKEEDLTGKEGCKICWTKEKNGLIIPCHHLYCCIQCINKLVNGEQDENKAPQCPVCRGPILDQFKIFIP